MTTLTSHTVSVHDTRSSPLLSGIKASGFQSTLRVGANEDKHKGCDGNKHDTTRNKREKINRRNAKGETPACTMCLSTNPLDFTRKLPLPKEKYVVAFRDFFVPAQGNAVHPCGAPTGNLMDTAEGAPRSPEHDFSGCDVEANTLSVTNEMLFALSAGGPFVYYVYLNPAECQYGFVAV